VHALLGDHLELQPVDPTRAGRRSVRSAGVKDEGAVSMTLARACAPEGSSCACDPALGPSRKTCMRADGDVACPPEAPNKRLVATGSTLTCASCTCSASSTCSGGGATFYSDSMCNTQLDDLVRRRPTGPAGFARSRRTEHHLLPLMERGRSREGP